ncbi:MAG: type II secretion system protein M [Gammaproteobacteria bacterium]|nr:MAG: type II secretion system protein M [Gammaproteobacteria bacterium]
MIEYWNRLASRERLILVLCGSVVLLVLYYFLVIDPLRTQSSNLATQIQAQQASLVWMKQAQQEVLSLSKSTGPQHSLQGSLFATVDRQATQYSLKPALKRLEPIGDDKVKLTFEQADFQNLINFLAQMQELYHVSVQTLSIQRGARSGYVDARLELTLNGGES